MWGGVFMLVALAGLALLLVTLIVGFLHAEVLDPAVAWLRKQWRKRKSDTDLYLARYKQRERTGQMEHGRGDFYQDFPAEDVFHAFKQALEATGPDEMLVEIWLPDATVMDVRERALRLSTRRPIEE